MSITAETQSYLSSIKERDTERMTDYLNYLQFFDGNQWRDRPRSKETRLVANYARRLVVKGVSYMFAGMPSFNVVGDDGAEHRASSKAERALQEIYRDNDLATLDFAEAQDAAVLGDGGFKVTWSAESGRVVVAPVDVQGIWVERDPDDQTIIRRLLQRRQIRRSDAERRWGLPAGEMPTTHTDRSQVWIVEAWTAETWEVEINGALVSRTRNPYGYVPYVIFPNQPRPHSQWGASDLEDLIDICEQFNRRISVVARVLEVAGYPITVLENVTGSEGIQADAGAVWELPPDSKAYLLDMLQGGGVGLHLDYIDLIFRVMHDLSETPRTAFGGSERALSGVALEVEVQPLIQKINRKRLIWDRVYRERNRMCLDMAERFGKAEIGGLRETVVNWAGVLPTDREGLVKETTARIADMTMSREQAIEVLGSSDAASDLAEVLAEARNIAGMFESEDDDDDANGDQGASPDDSGRE